MVEREIGRLTQQTYSVLGLGSLGGWFNGGWLRGGLFVGVSKGVADAEETLVESPQQREPIKRRWSRIR